MVNATKNSDAVVRTGALMASVSIIISQSLTLQRSLSSMSILDWIGMGVAGIAMPILIALAFARWPAARVINSSRSWLLATGALLQAIFVVFWPSYIMPGDLVFYLNGSLVILTGGTLQFAILGIALMLALHAVIVFQPSIYHGWEIRQVMIATGVSGGVLISGVSLGLATYTGWTMYLIPSLVIMLLVGFIDLVGKIQEQGDNKREKQSASPSNILKTDEDSAPKNVPTTRSLKTSSVVFWCAMIFMMMPFLLLAMNFQRPRYAPGFFFPLIMLGVASFIVLGVGKLISLLRTRLRIGSLSNNGLMALMQVSVLIAGCLNVVAFLPMVSFPPGAAATFFKSPVYLAIITGAYVAGIVAILPAITDYSMTLERNIVQSKKNANILLGGVVPALIVVVLLFEGTSTIFSWNFGDTEAIILTGAIIGLGGFFFTASVILIVITKIKSKKNVMDTEKPVNGNNG